MGAMVNLVNAGRVEPAEDAPPGLTPREPRTRTLLIANISRLDNLGSTPCVVNNISSGGARLTLSEAVPIDAEFKVHIPQRNLFRTAKLVWRKGERLGVAFLPEDAAAACDTEADKDKKIQALQAEVASLKAAVGALKYKLIQREGERSYG